MTTTADDIEHIGVNDYVKVEYEDDHTGCDTTICGVVDEISLDEEWPYIEIAIGGSPGVRLTWGTDGECPFAVTRMSYKETRIGTGEFVARLHAAE